jgi:hypothetical protein
MNTFEINNAFSFTDAAFVRVGEKALTLPSVPGGAPVPLIGDFVRIPGHDPFTFKVIGRELEYIDSAQMKVTYVLDLVVAEHTPPHLTLVK